MYHMIYVFYLLVVRFFFFSSRRRHTRCALVTGFRRVLFRSPVVAAAVLLDPDCIPDGINDSKKLSEIARARLHDELVGCARVGVGIASVEEIDSINILQASLLAMRRAVDALDHEIGRAHV